MKLILKYYQTVKYSRNYFVDGVRYFCVKKNGDSKNPDENISEGKQEINDKKIKASQKPKATVLRHKTSPVVSPETKQAAKNKLLSILSEIEIESDVTRSKQSNLNLARPPRRPSKKERFKDFQTEKSSSQQKIDTAVKAVADSFKENSEKIEMDLKEKLSSMRLTKKVDMAEDDDKTATEVVDEEIKENLMSSVHEVASTVVETPDPPKSELTRRLLRLSLDSKITPEKKKSMLNLLDGLKTEVKSTIEEPASISQQRFAEKKRSEKRMLPSKIDLFGSAPLNIFPAEKKPTEEARNEFWLNLQERELKLLVQFAPTNAFEEMIMWTEQGKHWKFPIDNETEMGTEEGVGFNEHVFLEHHLKGFPEKGPIRHFMELVCVGLSKNPYITVERKIENIDWFRNYFHEKEEILKATGAVEPSHSFQLRISS